MIEEVKAWVSNAGLWEIEAKGVPPKRTSAGVLLSQDGIFDTSIENGSPKQLRLSISACLRFWDFWMGTVSIRSEAGDSRIR